MALITSNKFAQPDWNDPQSVERALNALRNARDELSAHDAYDQFLWAVGDNQLGTFYPIVLVTLPELREILSSGGYWAQCAVMESLIDLTGSFVPHAGFESLDGMDIQKAVQADIQSMRTILLPFTTESGARSKCAVELIEVIDDQIHNRFC